MKVAIIDNGDYSFTKKLNEEVLRYKPFAYESIDEFIKIKVCYHNLLIINYDIKDVKILKKLKFIHVDIPFILLTTFPKEYYKTGYSKEYFDLITEIDDIPSAKGVFDKNNFTDISHFLEWENFKSKTKNIVFNS
jgi:hypothetical protein